MVEAHPLAQPVSPPLPHAHYYNQPTTDKRYGEC